jgi:hypothetical protein
MGQLRRFSIEHKGNLLIIAKVKAPALGKEGTTFTDHK